jgi:hypothetical protein
LHSFPSKVFPSGQLHLLNLIEPPIHGLHSFPNKAVLSGHLQIPFSIFPPLHLLIRNLLGKSIDDAYTKNNKNIKL